MTISETDKNKILDKVIEIVINHGLKATTMDMVASCLGMSKRTLYEIFESKNQMIRETFDYIGRRHHNKTKEIFERSSNMMEALIGIFLYIRETLTIVNANFFRDMDSFYSDVRSDYEKTRQHRNNIFMSILSKGVEEGVFREDEDYRIFINLLDIQLESLKRMEEHFPEDITLSQVSASIVIGALRSIATPKGMEILDQSLKRVSF